MSANKRGRKTQLSSTCFPNICVNGEIGEILQDGRYYLLNRSLFALKFRLFIHFGIKYLCRLLFYSFSFNEETGRLLKKPRV